MARKPEIRYIQLYTDGTAAKKIAPRTARPAAQIVQQLPKKKQVVYFDPLALGGILVAAVMLVLMFVGVFQLREAQQDVQAMQKYVDTLKVDNRDLKQSYSEECNLEEIEQAALALGMIPVEQAQQISIHVQLPHQEAAQPSFWENIGVFLTGLFA